ncbi:6-hydroxy-D-nicotine oxidase [Diplonema papillatum]|nr:6-hydroxy-D-nicotine oxidase [Diplonema papillatum]
MQAAVLLSVLALSGWKKHAAHSLDYTLPGDRLWPKPYHWAKLESWLEGSLAVRGDPAYNLTELYEAGIFNRRSGEPQPAAVAVPKTVGDVKVLLRFARRWDLRVAVYNRGHHPDVRNTADNSLLIRVSEMRGVAVDLAEGTVTIEGGTAFSEMLDAVAEATNNTLVAPHGAVPTVGVWGWAVGGGIGPLTRTYGLAVDSIVRATVVTANGVAVVATADNKHKDLLYALKGGSGPAFGVGVSLTLRLYPNPGPAMRVFIGAFPTSDGLADSYASIVAAAPNGGNAFYLLSAPGVVRILGFCFGAGCDAFMAGVAALPGCMSFGLPALCNEFPSVFPSGFAGIFSQSALPRNSQWTVGGTPTASIAAVLKEANVWTAQPGVAFGKQCWAEALMGGASAALDRSGCSTSVAPAMRESRQYMVCVVTWEDSASVAERQQAVGELMRFEGETIKPRSPGAWVYWNEAHHFFERSTWKARYWGSLRTYYKLLRIKLRYDPSNFLTCYHCVGWDHKRSVANVDPNICPEQGCSCSNNPTGECSTFDG